LPTGAHPDPLSQRSDLVRPASRLPASRPNAPVRNLTIVSQSSGFLSPFSCWEPRKPEHRHLSGNSVQRLEAGAGLAYNGPVCRTPTAHGQRM